MEDGGRTPIDLALVDQDNAIAIAVIDSHRTQNLTRLGTLELGKLEQSVRIIVNHEGHKAIAEIADTIDQNNGRPFARRSFRQRWRYRHSASVVILSEGAVRHSSCCYGIPGPRFMQ